MRNPTNAVGGSFIVGVQNSLGGAGGGIRAVVRQPSAVGEIRARRVGASM